MNKAEECKNILKSEGFLHIFEWKDEPDYVYSEHSHRDKVSMYILDGELFFKYNSGDEQRLKEGDRLDVQPNKKHTAKVGPAGCVYVVGEMIEGDS